MLPPPKVEDVQLSTHIPRKLVSYFSIKSKMAVFTETFIFNRFKMAFKAGTELNPQKMLKHNLVLDWFKNRGFSEMFSRKRKRGMRRCCIIIFIFKSGSITVHRDIAKNICVDNVNVNFYSDSQRYL